MNLCCANHELSRVGAVEVSQMDESHRDGLLLTLPHLPRLGFLNPIGDRTGGVLKVGRGGLTEPDDSLLHLIHTDPLLKG